MQERY